MKLWRSGCPGLQNSPLPFSWPYLLWYGLYMLSSISTQERTKFAGFLAIHSVITVICTAAAHSVFGREPFLSFVLGELFLWISLLSISLSVYLIFLKKNIALSVGVIVFKWPILIYVVYKLTNELNIQPGYLSIGFIPIFVSSLVWSALQKD